MRAIVISSLISAQIAAAPAVAAPSLDERTDPHRAGAFAGLRLRVPLGSQARSRAPRMALSIAPTRHQDGAGVVMFGEGVTLRAERGQPALRLAGVSVGKLPFQDGDDGDGPSTLGWIGIGVGTLLVVGVIGMALVVEGADSRDPDNDD